MGVRLRLNQDSVSGVMFAAFGAVGLYLGRDYPLGSAARMEGGYLPALLCVLLLVVGLALILKGASMDGDKIERWHLKPVFYVLLSTLSFAFLLDRIGFPLAAVVTTVIGALAGRDFKMFEVAVLAVCMTVACTLIFIYGLGLPMPLWSR